MNLKPKEKAAILAGHHPPLVREGKCPFEKGETISLVTQRSYAGQVAQVSITITTIKRGKKGEHLPEYMVRDDRDRFLRHRGGVTASPTQSVDPEASLVPSDFQRRVSAEGRLKTVMAGAKHRQRERVLRGEARVAEVRTRQMQKERPNGKSDYVCP